MRRIRLRYALTYHTCGNNAALDAHEPGVHRVVPANGGRVQTLTTRKLTSGSKPSTDANTLLYAFLHALIAGDLERARKGADELIGWRAGGGFTGQLGEVLAGISVRIAHQRDGPRRAAAN